MVRCRGWPAGARVGRGAGVSNGMYRDLHPLARWAGPPAPGHGSSLNCRARQYFSCPDVKSSSASWCPAGLQHVRLRDKRRSRRGHHCHGHPRPGAEARCGNRPAHGPRAYRLASGAGLLGSVRQSMVSGPTMETRPHVGRGGDAEATDDEPQGVVQLVRCLPGLLHDHAAPRHEPLGRGLDRLFRLQHFQDTPYVVFCVGKQQYPSLCYSTLPIRAETAEKSSPS